MSTPLTWLPAFTSEDGASSATELFHQTFGGRPEAVFSAPGRVNIIGEHVDYNGGICLPIALPHRAYVAVTPRADRLMRLVSSQTQDHIDHFDLDRVDRVGTPGAVKGWAAYLVGVLWALEQQGYGPLPGFDVALSSCVPLGAGLSSSAALECAMGVAVDAIAGLGLAGSIEHPHEEGRKVLVDVARSAENDIAGANTGGLDQSASLRCQAGHALRLDCRDMSAQNIPFDLAAHGLELLVVDTRAPHQLVDGQYAARRHACEDAAQLLGVELLADIAPEGLDQALGQLPDEVMRRRVRHVVGEIERTRHFIDLLSDGPLTGPRVAQAGALMNASHDSLRDDYEVTIPPLDLAVDTMREAGAHGARMTGGGFGGSAIAVVDAGHLDDVAAGVAQAFASHGFNAPAFLRAVPSAPAGQF